MFTFAKIHIFKLPQIISLAGLLLALGTPLVGVATGQLQSHAGTVASQTAAVATSSPDLSGEGISASFSDLSPAQLNTQMAAIAATGATWVRYDLSWNAVQQAGPTSYNWTASDQVTAAAEAHNLNVIMILDLTPPWDRVSDCNETERCAPKDVSAFGTFAGAAASHYASYGVHTWEIWNEPNISYRFGPSTDPAKYVAMLKASYPAIKAVDPTAVVLGGSTAPSATDAHDLRPVDFLAAMYADGARGDFDALAVHPYTYPVLPADSNPADAWGQLPAMYALMVSNGDGNKRIWITEYGAPTNGQGGSDNFVSEDAQAQMLTQAVSEFRAQPWSGPFLWYNWQDSKGSSSEDYYGLLRADGSAKPAFAAFVQAAATK